MDHVRAGVRDANDTRYGDVREEAQVPVRGVAAGAAAVGDGTGAKRSWLRFGLRVVRDAAIFVAVLAMVPIGIVAIQGDALWRSPMFHDNTSARVAQAEYARPLMLPRDPSITPMQAGLALNALQPTREVSSHFEVVEVPYHPEATWRKVPVTADMFPTAPPFYANEGLYGNKKTFNDPSTGNILELAAKGFTPKEMAFLQTLATAPVWREFDLVARAPAVDFIGGRFKIPFSNGALLPEMPILRYAAVKELAYASVSRAAYHLARGQRDSAETALRSVASFGFSLIDNGTSHIDELIGNVIVGIGRDGLRRLYAITGDPRVSAPAVAPPPSFAQLKEAAEKVRAASPTPDPRQELIASAGNRALHPAERYESLFLLSMSSCTNVRELVFGTRPDVEAAFRAARTNLARYPSERALVELTRNTMEGTLNTGDQTGPITTVMMSAATVAGTVFHNPRMAACTRIAAGWRAQF